MSLTFDPFREMDRLTAQLLGSAVEPVGARWMPMDLYRVDDHYVVAVDLPGVDPASIDVQVDGGTLTVRAERARTAPQDARWLARERPAGAYLRQLALGEGVDVERIGASYDAGVLTLTVPLAERARARRIEVSAVPSPRAVEVGADAS